MDEGERKARLWLVSAFFWATGCRCRHSAQAPGSDVSVQVKEQLHCTVQYRVCRCHSRSRSYRAVVMPGRFVWQRCAMTRWDLLPLHPICVSHLCTLYFAVSTPANHLWAPCPAGKSRTTGATSDQSRLQNNEIRRITIPPSVIGFGWGSPSSAQQPWLSISARECRGDLQPPLSWQRVSRGRYQSLISPGSLSVVNCQKRSKSILTLHCLPDGVVSVAIADTR